MMFTVMDYLPQAGLKFDFHTVQTLIAAGKDRKTDIPCFQEQTSISTFKTVWIGRAFSKCSKNGNSYFNVQFSDNRANCSRGLQNMRLQNSNKLDLVIFIFQHGFKHLKLLYAFVKCSTAVLESIWDVLVEQLAYTVARKHTAMVYVCNSMYCMLPLVPPFHWFSCIFLTLTFWVKILNMKIVRLVILNTGAYNQSSSATMSIPKITQFLFFLFCLRDHEKNL